LAVDRTRRFAASRGAGLPSERRLHGNCTVCPTGPELSSGNRRCHPGSPSRGVPATCSASFGPREPRSRSASNSSCAQFTAPPSAPDEVSISWNAGQILSIRLTIRSPAVTGSTLATFLISVTASFKRWQARCEPFHANARERSRGLNVQMCFVGIDLRHFGIRSPA